MKQLSLLLAYVESLTLPLVLAGAAGMYVLWQEGSRSLALLMACVFVFPIAFIVLVQIRTAVSTFYMSPATPGPLHRRPASFWIDWSGSTRTLRPRWLLSAAVAAMIFAAGAPTLISQYRDGRR